MLHDINFRNPFFARLIRDGRVIQRVRGYNGVVTVGKNHMLDVTFGAATPVTQIDPWYIGLISNSPTPSLAEADTLASHAGWSEFSSYSGGRKEWSDGDAASKNKNSSAVSTFSITGSGSIYGLFVCGASSGTSSVLWATGAFSSVLSVISGDEIRVTYGIRT